MKNNNLKLKTNINKLGIKYSFQELCQLVEGGNINLNKYEVIYNNEKLNTINDISLGDNSNILKDETIFRLYNSGKLDEDDYKKLNKLSVYLI